MTSHFVALRILRSRAATNILALARTDITTLDMGPRSASSKRHTTKSLLKHIYLLCSVNSKSSPWTSQLLSRPHIVSINLSYLEMQIIFQYMNISRNARMQWEWNKTIIPATRATRKEAGSSPNRSQGSPESTSFAWPISQRKDMIAEWEGDGR